MKTHGFTLIELIITLALVGLVAMVALPLYEISATRLKETELKLALRQIRTALDNYKIAADTGLITREAGDSGYPPSLEVLVTGVENAKDINHSRLVFLRHVPRDPFYPDLAQPAEQTWALRSYGSPPSDPMPGNDVYDVASLSAARGMNGIAYKEW
ncbi:type II secretion system protein [Collimonas antrihumi]|uniref:type II secretion system protein n=1 Tax=Collimonas antrihumi TaxID=1940615 RepID=UPI001B8C17FF|nr:type II secretion system protein [Collimonas antrihumi]